MSEPQLVQAAGYLLFRCEGENRQGPMTVNRDASLEFLLMRHKQRWDLPKGHQDPGESLIETADRELWEETGIKSQMVWRDPEFQFVSEYPVTYKKFPGETFQKRLTIFLGFLAEPVSVAITEHLGFEWWKWAPPMAIQTQAIDPLLSDVAIYLQKKPGWPNL